ncbi:GNAT family N-acetyltransferase [Brevundimonas sp. 2R-24]|uniref:GNAT family N-acetyltransferase n=1 Tax=Peiella sedimenti TaxID=3061083 RepID=A0ABT8SNS2_9CAUL|nr:GNAT family N-acetyltransferase [Caulobacteraceae bacterium XZ-24]
MTQPIQAEIVAPDQLTLEDRRRWRAFQQARPELASPYFHPAFTRIAGEAAPGAEVAILHRGGEVLGYYPFQRRGGRALPLAAPMADYHGVIAAPEVNVPVSALPGLLKSRSAAVTAWVGDRTGLEPVENVAAAAPDGWEAYRADRYAAFGKFFKDKERSRRALAADAGGEVVCAIGRREPELLDQIVAQKSAQLRQSRLHDIFRCGWTVDLLRALMACQDEGDFGASIAVLYAGDRIAALEYALHADDRYHFWFPVYDQALRRSSPGILLTWDTIRLASEMGRSWFDFGSEDGFYKKYFVNAGTTVGAGITRAQAGASPAPRHRLAASARRRWAVVEACETSPLGLARGAAAAAYAAAFKINASRSA